MIKQLTSGLSKKSLHVFQKFISPDYNIKTQRKQTVLLISRDQ